MGSIGKIDSEDGFPTGGGCGPAAEEVSGAFHFAGRSIFFFSTVDAPVFFRAVGSPTSKIALPHKGQAALTRPRKWCDSIGYTPSRPTSPAHLIEGIEMHVILLKRPRGKLPYPTAWAEYRNRYAHRCCIAFGHRSHCSLHSSRLGRRRKGP